MKTTATLLAAALAHLAKPNIQKIPRLRCAILYTKRAILYTILTALAMPKPRPFVLLRMREIYFYYISTIIVV